MSYHSYSDGESPTRPDFVNETIPRQTQTPSPRTELLSPTSPRPLQGEVDRIRSVQRGPSERYRRQREQAYASVSSRQLLSLLIEKEYESSKLRKALHKAFDRSEAETRRASEAERITQEALSRLRAINEGKVVAERALAKTNEELRLWKFQFDHAQREIARAQAVVGLVERQRDDAEGAASVARSAARKLNEQRLVSDAMEEGRRLGYQAGFRRAQEELGYARADETYRELEREIIEETHNRREENSESDITNSPPPAPRSPQRIRMPEVPVAARTMPEPAPAIAMPVPIPASPARSFQVEHASRGPPSARSPSIHIDHYAVSIPPPSVLNEPQPSSAYFEQRHPPSAPPDPVPKTTSPSTSRRPSSQAYQYPSAPTPPRRSSPTPSHQRPPASRPPDNYIPSISAEGGITLPPPFQLSQPLLPTGATVATSAPGDPGRTQSWYNRDRPPEELQAQSWYQPKRPRSNAGSATGRSNAGSAAGRSAHARQASLDSRMSYKNPKMGGREYEAGMRDLGAIKEDARSGQGPYAYSGQQRAKSMRESTESLVPPPLPAKDARHQKQVIADELRYSNPNVADNWRREASVTSGGSQGRPRHVRVPVNLTFPAPLSPPQAAPSGHIRARSMSESTGKSGWTQAPIPVDLGNRPSLRRVKERRPIVPSDYGSPFSGTINIEPPSQSSSQIPLRMSAAPGTQTDRFLSPNFQSQPLPSGFVPQAVTVPAQVTVPLSYKGKSISSPIRFPSDNLDNASAGAYPIPPPNGRPTSGLSDYRGSQFGGSTTSVNHRRSASMNAEPRPVSALSNHKASHAPPSLEHRKSNASMRSTGSYAPFDPTSYADPAFWGAEGAPVPVPAPRSRKVSGSSQHSGLEYFGPPL